MTPSSSSITTAQALTVTVAVNGGTGNPTPTGSVTLNGGGYTSAAITLSGGGGSIVIAAGSLLAGSDILTVSYSPDTNSSSTYNSASGSNTVFVSKITPTVIVTPSSANITTAQALSVSVMVNGGTGNPIPSGTVTLIGGGYASAATTLSGGNATINVPAGSLTTGSDILAISYTPDNSGSSIYNNASGSNSVTVTTATKTTPTITWATPVAITFGTALTGTQLNATANVPGAFTYAPAVGTVLMAGAQTLTVTFTPTDIADYISATTTVQLMVNKATPTVTAWPTASAITVGQTLASSTLSGGASSVGGTFTWTTPTAAPGVGNYSGSVTFTPTDTTDYNTVTGTVTVTVNVNATPGFTLSPLPMSVSIAQGGSGATTITVTDVGGFSGNVGLAATGLPSGITSSFAAGSAAGTQVLTLMASTSAQVTSTPVTVTVTGTSGTLSAITSVSLTITAQPSFTAGGGGTTSLSITPGSTTGNTGTISIAGTNGFTGTVDLKCSVTTSISGANDMPSCSLNPSSVTISGSAAQISTLTVNTIAPTNAENRIYKLIWPESGTALALIVLLAVPRRRRNWLLITSLFLVVAAFGVAGCGGGSITPNTSTGNPGTTAGTYTISVIGTSGSVSATVGIVTLTVQ
jgi:hypothetical protein